MQKIIYVVLSIILFVPVFVFAAGDPPPEFVTNAGRNLFDNIIGGIVGFLSTLFLSAGIIAMLYAGYLFLSSGGDVEKTTTARKNFLWGLVGLLVGLSAYAAPALIKTFLQQE